VRGRTSRSKRSSVTLDSAVTPDQGCLNGALMSASLVNVKEHFSHLMLNHPAVNRPVRTRMRGGVGSGGEKPPLTRLEQIMHLLLILHSLNWHRNKRFNGFLNFCCKSHSTMQCEYDGCLPSIYNKFDNIGFWYCRDIEDLL